MKQCNECSILVGGSWSVCPICQNTLTGDACDNIWPPQPRLHQKKLLLKLLRFVIFSGIAVSLILDFLMGICNDRLHWSLLVLVCGLLIGVQVNRFSDRKRILPCICTESVLCLSLMTLFSAWYLGYLMPCIRWIIPVLISLMLLFNAIYVMVTSGDSGAVYLLISLFLLLVPYCILLGLNGRDNMSAAWNVGLILGIVALIATVVFKGGIVLAEARRRMTF